MSSRKSKIICGKVVYEIISVIIVHKKFAEKIHGIVSMYWTRWPEMAT